MDVIPLKDMTSLHLKSQISIDLDYILDGVARLETREMEEFMAEVSYMLAKRRAPHLSRRESELLQGINQGLPVHLQQRYHELREKSQEGMITATEREELLAMVDQVELADAQRLKYLIELAQLRQESLDELLSQLEIQNPPING